MRNAIRLGATREQLLAVLEVVSTIGTEGYLSGMAAAAAHLRGREDNS